MTEDPEPNSITLKKEAAYSSIMSNKLIILHDVITQTTSLIQILKWRGLC